MRAVVVTRFGGPEVLELRDEPEPVAGPDDLLVEPKAIGVNYRDIYEREGRYGGEAPLINGVEGAGKVVAGPSRRGTRCLAGRARELCGTRAGPRRPGGPRPGRRLQRDGGRCAPPGRDGAVPRDERLSHPARRRRPDPCSRRRRRPPPDADREGAGRTRDRATSGGEKAVLARGAGADEVISYEGFRDRVRELTGGEGVAVAYDGVGQATFDESLASVRTRGTMVLFGAASGPVPPFDPMRLEHGGSFFLTRPRCATTQRTERSCSRGRRTSSPGSPTAR